MIKKDFSTIFVPFFIHCLVLLAILKIFDNSEIKSLKEFNSIQFSKVSISKFRVIESES